jgi:hypothetical protein
MLELIWTHTTQNFRNLVSVHVWRVVVAAATSTSIFDFRLEIYLGYGLDFLLGTLALQSGTRPWLDFGSKVFFCKYSLCQG